MLILKIRDFLETVSSDNFCNLYLIEILKTANKKLFWFKIRLIVLVLFLSVLSFEISSDMLSNDIFFQNLEFYIKLLILLVILVFLFVNINSMGFYSNISILTNEIILSFNETKDTDKRARILNRYFLNIREISGLGLIEIFFSFKKHNLSNLIKNVG